MSDNEIIRKLASIVIKQQKIINKLAGVDWTVTDSAMKNFVLGKASGLVAPYGGVAKVSLSRSAVADNASLIQYDVDVKLSVPSESDKVKVERLAVGFLDKVRADLAIESAKEGSPLKGCTMSQEGTVTVFAAPTVTP